MLVTLVTAKSFTTFKTKASLNSNHLSVLVGNSKSVFFTGEARFPAASLLCYCLESISRFVPGALQIVAATAHI